MIKVDVHRGVGQTDDEWPCDAAFIATVSRDENGEPSTARVQLTGKFSLTDAIVMAKMLLENIDQLAKDQYELPNFDILKVLYSMMKRHDHLLHSLDENSATQN